MKQSAVKLFQAIELRRRGVPLHRFIYALGIPNVGSHTAKVLASHYVTLDAFRKASVAAAKGGSGSLAHSALTQVKGVGPVLAQSVIDFWGESSNATIVDEILANGVVVLDAGAATKTTTLSSLPIAGPATSAAPPRADLAGARVLFTGTVDGFTREAIHDLIQANNGELASSLSSKTSFVLAGVGAGPSKLARARELGVPVLDARDFIADLTAGRPINLPK